MEGTKSMEEKNINTIYQLSELMSEGKPGNDVANFMIENNKLTDMQFGDVLVKDNNGNIMRNADYSPVIEEGFNMHSLASSFVTDNMDVEDFGKELESKRNANVVSKIKNSAIDNEAWNDIKLSRKNKEVKHKSPACKVASFIQDKDFGIEDVDGVFTNASDNMILLESLTNDGEVSKVQNANKPVEIFMWRALRYFGEMKRKVIVSSKKNPDEKIVKEEDYNPLTPFVATAILARTFAGTYYGKKSAMVDNIENVLETYMLALIKHDMVGTQRYTGKEYDTALIENIVNDAINLVDVAVENINLQENGNKITVKPSAYLHDLNLCKTLGVAPMDVEHIMSDIDQGATSPLSYVDERGFTTPIFADESDFVFADEQDLVKLVASGEKNQVWSALKRIQAEIVGVDVNGGQVDSRFVDHTKNLQFAVRAVKLLEIAGLANKNPELAQQLAEGFAEVYSEGAVVYKNNEELAEFVKTDLEYFLSNHPEINRLDLAKASINKVIDKALANWRENGNKKPATKTVKAKKVESKQESKAAESKVEKKEEKPVKEKKEPAPQTEEVKPAVEQPKENKEKVVPEVVNNEEKPATEKPAAENKTEEKKPVAKKKVVKKTAPATKKPVVKKEEVAPQVENKEEVKPVEEKPKAKTPAKKTSNTQTKKKATVKKTVKPAEKTEELAETTLAKKAPAKRKTKTEKVSEATPEVKNLEQLKLIAQESAVKFADLIVTGSNVPAAKVTYMAKVAANFRSDAARGTIENRQLTATEKNAFQKMPVEVREAIRALADLKEEALPNEKYAISEGEAIARQISESYDEAHKKSSDEERQ